MAIEIKIPNADRDERIGSVFNHLFRIMLLHERNNREGDIVWDFSNTSFFHPFFLFPFALFRSRYNNIRYKGMPTFMRSYLNYVKFDEMLDIKDNMDLAGILYDYANKSYIPICRFNRQSKNLDSMQTVIQEIIERQRTLDYRLKTPISYLISELVCNIDQHSESKFGYIYTQYLQRDNSLNICIADNGITIYGSYVKTNKHMEEIGENEAEALKFANEGFSTKDLPNAENRGFGISSSKRMIVEGLGGAFFMLSGGAFHRHDTQGSDYIRLPEAINWDGTVILIRIPLKIGKEFDYMKYIR